MPTNIKYNRLYGMDLMQKVRAISNTAMKHRDP
jgi:hypothetical protein